MSYHVGAKIQIGRLSVKFSGGQNEKKQQCLVGIGGWDHDAFDSVFYPRRGLDSVRRLALYSESFDFAEVRHTFWDDALPLSEVSEWIAAVSGNRKLQFSVRLHKLFTHKKSLTPKATRTVRSILHELVKCNRLFGLHAQFPYGFTNTSSNRFHLVKLAEVFAGFPFFVELRNSSWDTPDLSGFLSDHSIRLVSTDMPRLTQYPTFRSDESGGIAYLRLHGRNEKGWLVNGVDTRYDYLYNGRELKELKRRIDRMMSRAETVAVVFNNTTGGKALANAFQLQAVFSPERNANLPLSTLGRFPFLLSLAEGDTQQTELPVGSRWKEVI